MGTTMEWQPIKTAPKTIGEKILTYGYVPGSYGYYETEFCYSISSWSGNGWSSQASKPFGNSFVPTHWMPLPEAPGEQGEVLRSTDELADYKTKYLLLTAQYSRDIGERDALINSLADYVERVPDDRYNAEHLDRDALVAKAKELLDVTVLG